MPTILTDGEMRETSNGGLPPNKEVVFFFVLYKRLFSTVRELYGGGEGLGQI